MHKVFGKPSLVFTAVVIASMVLASCAPATATPTSSIPSTGSTPSAAAPTTAVNTPAPVSPTTAPTASSTQVKNPNTLVYATISDPQSLDPAWQYDTASQTVDFNVYETLLFPNKTSATSFVPMLATSWTVSPDGKTYTFNIRQGVTFQNGDPLTAQDVAYSFWRVMITDRSGGPSWIMLEPFFGLNVASFANDVVKAQFGGNWVAAAQAVENAVTYDNTANTVTLHLKQPYGPMLQILSGSWAEITDMAWVVKLGGWDGNPADAQKYNNPAVQADPLFNQMNGTGPYKFVRWVPNQEVDLVRNDSYWLKTPLWSGGPSGPASIQNVIIKNIPEFSTRFATLQTGDSDIAYVDTQYISQVQPYVQTTCDASGKCTTTNPNGRLTLYSGLPSVESVDLFLSENVNTTGGNPYIGSGKLDGNGVPPNFFSDINVRKAFNYCFDWNTYIQQAYSGQAIQAFGPIIQGELGYDPNQAHYSFDLTKCADAFKASTLKSASGASLWDTGFYLQYIYNVGNDQRKTAGDILAQNLLKVNPKFHLQVVGEPFPLELSDQTAGRLPIYALGWLEDYHDPQDWVVPFMSSGGTYAGTQAFPSAVQTQLDNLITQGVSTTDSAARAKIYAQIQNIAYQNALNVFLVQPQINVYLQNWVKGWYYNPTYPNPGFYFYALSK
ncbi:MAG: ABC transporter substrate-binding protein [Chloroflexi bacterium]|nr:ABC transporter substrate-binding protein [Chloroflexota bacterium]